MYSLWCTIWWRSISEYHHHEWFGFSSFRIPTDIDPFCSSIHGAACDHVMWHDAYLIFWQCMASLRPSSASSVYREIAECLNMAESLRGWINSSSCPPVFYLNLWVNVCVCLSWECVWIYSDLMICGQDFELNLINLDMLHEQYGVFPFEPLLLCSFFIEFFDSVNSTWTRQAFAQILFLWSFWMHCRFALCFCYLCFPPCNVGVIWRCNFNEVYSNSVLLRVHTDPWGGTIQSMLAMYFAILVLKFIYTPWTVRVILSYLSVSDDMFVWSKKVCRSAGAEHPYFLFASVVRMAAPFHGGVDPPVSFIVACSFDGGVESAPFNCIICRYDQHCFTSFPSIYSRLYSTDFRL